MLKGTGGSAVVTIEERLRNLFHRDVEQLPPERYTGSQERLRELLDAAGLVYSEHQIVAVARYLIEYGAWAFMNRTERENRTFGGQEPIRKYAPPKGLLMHGPTGTGKTSICRVIRTVFPETVILDLPQCAEEFAMNGYQAIAEIKGRTAGGPLVLDDLGAEPDVRHYSNDGFVRQLIYWRYNHFVQSGWPLIVTTNRRRKTEDDVEGLEELYGDRVFSRMTEMMEPIGFGGQDHRTGDG